MNIDVPLADSLRIEVLANGLPGPSCTARAGADRVPGKAAVDAGRRKHQTTYPELLAARRCWLVILAVEVGGRFVVELADFPDTDTALPKFTFIV